MTPQRELSNGLLQALSLILLNFIFHQWLGGRHWWKASHMHTRHGGWMGNQYPGRHNQNSKRSWQDVTGWPRIGQKREHFTATAIKRLKDFSLLLPNYRSIVRHDLWFSKIKCNHRSLHKKYLNSGNISISLEF